MHIFYIEKNLTAIYIKFLNFDGIIETDSGSYQMLHYKKDLEIKIEKLLNIK